jgi:hypothetical protein
MPRFFSPALSRLLGCLALAALVGPAFGQLNNGNQWPSPKLNSIFPAGGKVGESVEVTFTGADVDQPDSLWFNHPGIKGVPIVPPEPTPDPKKPDEKKDKKKDPAAITKFTVTIDKSVPPGMYDVRLVNGKGISNPRVFVVGELAEIQEKEPNNDVEQAQKIDANATVNGIISAPTDVDYFQVSAKKGQRLLFHLAGASIDSRISPELRLFDAQGRSVAYTRALPNEDALLDFTAPADGDYWLRLNQFTYTAGASEYFYRLSIWPGPWVDAVFPPVVEAGKSAAVTVFGRGLPGGKLDPAAQLDGRPLEKLAITINAPADTGKLDVLGSIPPYQGVLPGFEYRLGNSNPKFIAFAIAPVVIENDDNDTLDKAQAVKVPCEIAGRVDKLRDRDWFAFDAKKGDVFIIDGASQRLGAPTDLYVKLLNIAKKQEIVLLDDNAVTINPRGYYSANRDPEPYRFVVPEDGKYHLLVGSHSADSVAGPTNVYRVRISPEKPDFQLVVMPAEDYRADACNLGKGGVGNFNVFAQRLDGFKDDIALSIEGLPKGVTCPPQILGGNTKSALLAVVVGDEAPEKFEGVVKVVGTATVGGQKVTREARPASVTWGAPNPQNNTPTVTRQDRALVLAIRGKAPLKVTPEKDKVVVIAGDKADVSFKLARIDADFKGNFQIQATPGELPVNVTATNLTFAPGKDEQKLTLTAQATAVPGRYNLVLRGFAPIAPPKGKNVNTILPSAPMTLIIVPKQVATLTVDNANPPLKAGGETAVTLKVARQFDYPGEFKVQLLPDNTNGVSAQELVIGAGQNDAKLILKAADGVNPGPRQNLTVRAIAVVEGVSLNHDVKINVNVMAEKKAEPKKDEPKKDDKKAEEKKK